MTQTIKPELFAMHERRVHQHLFNKVGKLAYFLLCLENKVQPMLIPKKVRA